MMLFNLFSSIPPIDELTLIFILSIGSYIFGILLFVFQYKTEKSRKIPFWVSAKLLQGTGSLILFLRSTSPDFITLVLGNNLLLLGCAYETWSIFSLVGYPIGRRVHISVTLLILFLHLSTGYLSDSNRTVFIFFSQSVVYFLAFRVLVRETSKKSPIRKLMASGYLILTLMNLFICLDILIPNTTVSLTGKSNPLRILPILTFGVVILNSFSILLLAKENLDDQLQKSDESLKQAEIQYKLIVETANEGIIALNENNQITYLNEKFAEMLKYERKELFNAPISDLVIEKYKFQFNELNKNPDSESEKSFESCFLCKDGFYHYVLISMKILSDPQGKYAGSFGMITDINERKNLEKQLFDLAIKDSLTGVYNRRHFLNLTQKEIEKARTENQALSLAIIDVDHFKQINDTYGHSTGDEVLLKIVNSILQRKERTDILGRFGGDEFVLLLPNTSLDKSKLILDEIRESIYSDTMRKDRGEIKIGLSIGISSLHSKTDSLDSLLERADLALYKSKNAGRNCVHIESLL